MKINRECLSPKLFLMLLAGFLIVQPAMWPGEAQGDTKGPSEAEEKAYEDLIEKWEDKEWELFQKAQAAALQIQHIGWVDGGLFGNVEEVLAHIGG